MIGFKDFLSIINETFSPSEGKSLPVSEVLSFQARRKKSIALRRRKQQIQRQRKIALKRPATLSRLKRRGRKTARDILTKRYYGGKTKRDMSISQKQRVEKRLEKAGRVTGVISKRLLPSKRKLDVQRRRG